MKRPSFYNRSALVALGLVTVGLALAGSGVAQIKRPPKGPQRPTSPILKLAPSVILKAATATVGARPQVRLRWQLPEGWIPAGGFKLYAVKGTTKRLVKAIAPPNDTTIDNLLGAKFKGRKVGSLAATNRSGLPKLTFDPIRGTSQAGRFQNLKTLTSDVRKLRGSKSAFQKTAPLIEMQKALQSALRGPKGIGSGFKPANTGLEPTAASIVRARQELTLASLVDPRAAETIGLGAVDSAVQSGESVRYELYEVSATGAESKDPVGVLASFVVGADPVPPAPTGITFAQDENQIFLRWDRVAPAFEKAVGAVSYRISRTGGGVTSPVNLTPKPVLILDTSEEPLAFFTDRVTLPGTYQYTVTLVDGFGRSVASAPFSATVEDWRRPEPPKTGRAVASVRAAAIQPRLQGGKITPPPSINFGRPTVSLVWEASGAEPGLSVRYKLYRQDLDQAGSEPVPISATPLAGIPLEVGTSEQLNRAVLSVYGDDYFAEIDNAIVELEGISRSSSSPAAKAKADASLKSLRIAKAKRMAILKARWQARPPLQTPDLQVGADRKFSYFVTAMYAENELESEPTPLGDVQLPSDVQPPMPAGLAARFTASPKRAVQFSLPKNNLVKASKAKVRQPQTKQSLGVKPLPQAAAREKLTIPPVDTGGTVTLTWNAVNLKEVVYKVQRKSANGPTVDLGTVKGKTTFTDSIPRGKQREVIYLVTAISRWGIAGAVAQLPTTLPATVTPSTPFLLSAAPKGDGEIQLSIARPPVEDGVSKITILRDGAPAGTLTVTEGETDLTFIDTGCAPKQSHSYTVVTETAAGTKSAASNAVKAFAVKQSTAPATNGRVTVGETGVVLSWNAPAGTAYAIIRRSTGAGQPVIVVGAKVVGTTFLDTSALTGRAYIYSVVLVDSSGNVSTPLELRTP